MHQVPKGPWYVRDFRAAEMRRLGWTGPSIDRILITSSDAAEIAESSGANCVVARIQFDNRHDELTEQHLADAALIAAAPDMYDALSDLVRMMEKHFYGTAVDAAKAALAKARGEST